jgi:hypothetical protein
LSELLVARISRLPGSHLKAVEEVPMAMLQRLSADAIASELSKLPLLTAPAPSTLDAVRIAIARAIASGQSADQLSTELGLPAGWQGTDLSLPPAAGSSGPNAAVSAPQNAVPDWIGKIVPLALAKATLTRIAVLDREPTALGGLEGPAWARALQPSATYGPVTVASASLQIDVSKWIHVYHFSETVEFMRAGSVLCVLPLSGLHFGSSTQASIASGSAWIAVNPFDASAPAGSFAGIAVQSGALACDQPISLASAVVDVPAGATISVTLTPAPQPAGAAASPVTATGPGTILAVFPPTGTPSIVYDLCSATLCGDSIQVEGSIDVAGSNQPAAYNADLQMLYLPGYALAAEFTPALSPGSVMSLGGAAPLQSAGWALAVSESATPATLGAADVPGYFAMVFGAGLTCQWTGLSHPETAAGGFLLAQNGQLVLSALSGSAPGVWVKQRFQLWQDQDSTNKRRCQLVAGRNAGQTLLYALAGNEEILELGAVLEALVDRPVLASGARVPAIFVEGIVGLIRNHSNYRLLAYSNAPLPETTGANQTPTIYPLALDNALLEVGEPLALLMEARTDAQFNASEGLLLLLFEYLLAELYLPDPYTGSLAAAAVDRSPVNFNSSASGGSVLAGFLLAEVVWTAPDKVALRLMDLEHPHPALPPGAEAGSTAVPPLEYQPLTPLHLETAAPGTGAAPAKAKIADESVAPKQPPEPLPAPAAGAILLDLSTRASQLGVEVETGERQDREYTIDGLSVRGPASLLPLTTLPAIAWEPMYNMSTDPRVNLGVDNNVLLHPPGDGPFSQVRATSATLIPISPLQSLQAVLDAGTGKFNAQLTLPFGMVGVLSETTENGTILPELTLVQPSFAAASTPSGAIYTGAWQLSFAAPDPTQPDPVLAGRTYLRTPADNPPSGLSYGEMVLGTDVQSIFSSEFDPPAGSNVGTGVPLRRYDLTGYGASTFSEWTDTSQATTGVIKAYFHVLVGRTSHEVIQVQSLVYPWAIKVIRTITIDRQASGVVQRYDSGWQAASDGLFNYPAATGIAADQVHAGLLSGLINVKNIQELGFPLSTQGTQDNTGPGTSTTAPTPGTVTVQPVTFDADVAIQPQHQVLLGGAKLPDLNGQMRVCVPSTGVTGFIPLTYDYHLSLTDMVNFGALAAGAGGSISATLNVGQANSLLRATSFDAIPVSDSATGGLGIACAVRGIPKLSSDGSWSVAARTQAQAAPVALPPTQGAPVVQPNGSGSTPGNLIHYANPADIFRLAPPSTTLPETFYGFLQATGTQSNFLSRPILTVGSQNLTLGDALNVAHAGALLGAIGGFPAIASCLQFLQSDPDFTPITNELAGASLSTAQNLFLKPPVRSKPISLISTLVADVQLLFYQKGEDPNVLSTTPNVQIALGQTSGPSWSLSVNDLAVVLVIPALSNSPVIWFQGGFHADADTTPGFPNLQVAFDGPLSALTTIFTVLDDIASVLSPGGASGSGAEGADGPPGLNVSFSDGKLEVTDNFILPSIPLGLGTIENVSLDIGTTLDIVALEIDFLVGIGSPDAPCQWIADPLSGTLCVQAGIQNNEMDVLIQAGIGVGLSIDLGIASGSASIVIAVQLQINGVPGGAVITILLLLTGQAQVDVLGGLASAAITLTAGLGFSIDTNPVPDINLIGTASVGIHISICWVVNISWSGSWTFQKELPFNPLLP